MNEQQIINSEETLKLWLNAYEYHRDQEKLKDIQKLTGFLPFNFFEYFMIDSLFAKSQVILNILEFVSNIVDKKSCTIEFEKSNKSLERNI